MAAAPNKTPGNAPDKKQWMTILVPAVGIAVLIVLIAVMASVGGSERTMSDGSDGSAGDPGLKQISPGVQYRDIREGQGEPCPPGAKVKIHYTGWLPDGTVFDSSKDRGQPATFDLDGLIQGWQEGIPGMKPGGIRKLVIAPEKGYGSQAKGKIPANSTLIFEVELLEVVPKPQPKPAPTTLSDGTAPGADDPGLKEITGGLKYRDLKEGTGAEVRPGDTVTIHYTGWLLNGNVFDSSVARGEPATFPLNDLIKGWQLGIPGMKVGGVRKLVIPPDLGYGSRAQQNIPANSTLVFEIELLDVK
jgi:FKBP-type peptidyl-prolyl cis-trans isomerase